MSAERANTSAQDPAETAVHAQPVPLQPIKTSWLESWRLMRQSYNSPLEHGQYLQQRYGNVVLQQLGRIKFVHMFGADANRLALLNPQQILSNKKSWDMIIGRIFPNGLMLRDGEDHRYHRRLMQAGFKSRAMQGYLTQMAPQVRQAIDAWPGAQHDNFLAFPAFKKMTLDLAATIFLGMALGKDASMMNRAFETAVAASMPRVPVPIPGNLLWRGIRARRTLCRFFLPQVAGKRAGNDQDLFALLCRAEDENGKGYTDQEIVDHIIFLMMAAHDTTTSTLTSMTYALAKNPEWQDKLREEVNNLDSRSSDHEQLSSMSQTEWVMKEALRLYPPLSTLPKYSNAEFEFEGHLIPAGAMVVTYPIHTHYMPAYWDQPTLFDPARFSPARAEQKRHGYSWVPFSGGAHMCIGLHFAEMQIKLVMREMLTHYSWQVAPGYTMPVQQSPISKPRDNLPIQLHRR
ncbi:MAG: cytochrome P450 [Pseudomonadales bacterium]|jgi:cytochrome P450|nr:cytochrome P450 [Pseudomonadales bacterium]MDP4641052.1 cytochrome P450 [Pseudomonadales bacterium]MDP4765309.1 cytochrome P450 [Pseudomonadales bacterium]MDP4875907.1 cytochrome P450 [Pseudomonadales bacterium]MDP4912289.1 cytochrome P450 [Pseudomonadales bacterium]